MQYFEIKPNPVLANIVKCFWFLEKDYGPSSSVNEMVLPDGCVDFIFQSGGHNLLVDVNGQLIRQPSSFVIGQQNRAVIFTSTGMTSMIGIRFYAYGAYPILHVPLNELTNQIVDLKDVMGAQIARVAERVNALSPIAAMQELENFLISQLAQHSSDIIRIQSATQLLFHRNGSIDIANLAHYTNLSIRTLERKFKEVVGYSPKALARVIRFNRAKDALMLNPSHNLTNLTHQFGFFDQAHFIHDFSKFSGKTPSAFAEAVTNREIYFYK
jgi:AraC-like DNA-binding protein